MKNRERATNAGIQRTEHPVLCPGPVWKFYLLLLPFVLIPVMIQAAEEMEIKVELESTWQSPTTTNHHRAPTVTCIVGTNGWYISGDFSKNAKTDYWLVGTNVIEHTLITSSMFAERAKDFVSEKILQHKPRSPILMSYPRAGQTFTKVYPSPLGQPVFGGMAGVVWLAFCSGDYLKQAGRQVPMPIGPSSQAFGYSDKTVTFADSVGLPKSVDLFATNGTLVCHYQVLKTTNFLGQTIPIQFQVVQLGQPANGDARLGSTSDLRGRVISLQRGKRPELPQELREKLERYNQAQ